MISSIKSALGLGITVEALLEKFMESRRALNLREATITNYGVHINWMRRQFGHRKADSVTSEEMRAVYREKSRKAVELTQVVYRWGKSQKLLRHIPTEGVLPRVPRGDESAISHLSATDAHRFLDAAHPEYRAAFVLALFAGLRPFEVCRIDWAQINVPERRIKVEAWVSKIRRARIIEAVPEILWNQLAPVSKPSGRLIAPIKLRAGRTKLNVPMWICQRRRAAERANITLAHDVLRHTFATYFVALTGSTAAAAKVLGHYGLQMLAAHYDGVSTCAEAEAFFQTTRKDFFAKTYGVDSLITK